VVDEYADLMRAGHTFPPVTVFYDGQSYWLADGFHRFRAWRPARPHEPIDVEVLPGTLTDAQWYSYGVNKAHGLRRTNEDKERAVLAALQHAKAEGLSNRQIAEHCGVDEKTVRNYRTKKGPTAENPQSTAATERLAEGELQVPVVAATTEASQSSPEETRTSPPPRLRTGRDGRTINTAKIGADRAAQADRRAPSGDGRLSPKARPLLRGHSSPVPMISLQFCPSNPQTAAATLWQMFPREFVEALVQDLSQRLSQHGERT
jgi:hypothetical protein